MSMSKSATGEKPTGLTHRLYFDIGQLAAAMIGIPKDDERHNALGRITKIEGEDVTLEIFGGERIEVKADNLKQLVHYDKSRPASFQEGSRGNVYGLDHPDWGSEWLLTSTVLRAFSETGFFETRNTVYVASYVDVRGFGDPDDFVHSPLLSKLPKLDK